MSKEYAVRAKRWKHGWELHIEGEGVTQVRTLATAEQQVRDYLESLHDRSFATAEIAIWYDMAGLERDVDAAREATRAATEAQTRAAMRSRSVASTLRQRGLSVSDTAFVLGVSRGRVSQLTSTTKREQVPH